MEQTSVVPTGVGEVEVWKINIMNVDRGQVGKEIMSTKRDVPCTLQGTHGFEVSKSEEAYRFFFSHPNFFEGSPTEP